MTLSLHNRLVILVGMCSASVLALSGFGVCILVEAQLWDQFDKGLHDRLLHLAQLVEQKDGTVEFEWTEPGALPIHAPGERITCWRSGQVLSVLPDGAIPLPLPPDIRAERPYPVSLTTGSASGQPQPGRAMAMRFVPRVESQSGTSDAIPISLIFARPTRELYSSIEILRWSIASTALLALTLTSAGTWLSVRRGLAPLRDATRRIAEVTPQRLHQELGVGQQLPTELRPLFATIDGLLSRLQVAMERERAFAAEVAHEMRTPLAGLRAKFDLALAKSRTAEELTRLIEDCSRINRAATAMIESLMATMAPIAPEGEAIQLVNLSRIVEECVVLYDDRMTERGLNVEHQIVANLWLPASEQAMRIAVRNLIENAIAYADLGSTIEVDCFQTEYVTGLRIRNVASGFPADQIDRVFERFWRADASRTETDAHSGLGLALTKRIIEAHGGTIAAAYRGSHFEILVRWNRTRDNGRLPD